MRPIPYLILCLALFAGACNNYELEPEQAEGFIKFFSRYLTEEAYDVKPAADGGYVAIGSTTDENGMRDLYLVKTDEYGNEESWSPAIIGGRHDDVGTSIQADADGYVILGYSNERDTSEYDLYLVKTDLQGKVIWQTWSGVQNDDMGTCLQITSAGEYLVAGLRRNNLGTDGYFIRRYDVTGQPVTVSRFINPPGTVLNAYIVEAQEYFMLCATVQADGKNHINITALDKESHWGTNEEKYYSSGDLNGNCIQVLGDGNLLFCGTRYNTQSGRNEVYLNKIGPDLRSLAGWESPKYFSSDDANLSGNAVREIAADRYVVLGTRTATGNDDILLVRTDGSGNEVLRRTYGDAGLQRGVSLELTGNEGLIIVGSNGAEDKSMMALLRTDADGNL